MMNMKEFAAALEKEVGARLGEEAVVKLNEVTKNNGVVLQGLSVGRLGRNVSATIYLDSFYEMYKQDVSLSEIARRIASCQSQAPGTSVDMEFFSDFDRVKERIAYRLVNAERNKELLEKIPHIRFLDLAVCFYYAFSHETLGKGIITVYNNHVQLWHTSAKELLKLAGENTPKLFSAQYRSLLDILGEMKDGGLCPQMQEDIHGMLQAPPMKVLSNHDRVQGAACILYPGLLQKICEKEGANFYILPSSVHEVILLADHGGEEPGKLREMVREVNGELVEPEEVLSDSVYYYDREKKALRII